MARFAAEAYVAEWVVYRDSEWAAEAASELAAERAMKEWAGGYGYDHEALEDLRLHQTLWPNGCGTDETRPPARSPSRSLEL
jgi:hypothetical protein